MSAVYQTSSILPETVDEGAVRRLCGAAVFVEADTLQRDGHVLGPTRGEQGPLASVRGTWRRVDHVAVAIRAGRLLPSCTRDGDVFCRHVGALLLQCLRDPGSVTAQKQPAGDTAGIAPPGQGAAAPRNDAIETPDAELARLLDQDTTQHLRQIAKRRGVRVSGTKKTRIVQQLTSALLEPANIDAAIAGLDRAERLALDATYLMSGERPAMPESVCEGVRALGGNGAPPLDALQDTGLVAAGMSRQVYGLDSYVVPRAVAARLPTRDDLARHADVALAGGAPAAASRLGIIPMIQVIAQASLADHIHLHHTSRKAHATGSAVPGFIYDPAEVAAGLPPPDRARMDGIRLVPPRLLDDADLTRLSDRTGQPAEAIDFVVRLMLALQIAHAGPGLTIRFDQLQALLDMPPPERLEQLANAWLRTGGPAALDVLFGPNGTLELRWTPLFGAMLPGFHPAIAAVARLVARLAGRMTPDTPYDVASFAGMVESLAPHAAPMLQQLNVRLPGIQTLRITSRTGRGKKKQLALHSPEGWNGFLTALVTALLDGPLTWLGFVEVSAPPGQARTFRVLPEAGVLGNRHEDAGTTGQPGKLVIDDDLTVLVPPEATDIAVHGLLSRAGQLTDASMSGLRYRLTPAGIQAIFDTGMTGPELAHLLADHAGGELPEPVRTELDHLWQHYGTIRLYDELTVIELSDDLLLAEMEASTSLGTAIVQTFSPRLIAIDAAQTEDIIAGLTERGYAPRVVEGG